MVGLKRMIFKITTAIAFHVTSVPDLFSFCPDPDPAYNLSADPDSVYIGCWNTCCSANVCVLVLNYSYGESEFQMRKLRTNFEKHRISSS